MEQHNMTAYLADQMFARMRPGPQPENAGITPGYVRQSSLEERTTRLEGIVERLVDAMSEYLAARQEFAVVKAVQDRIDALERENRNLRAELGQKARA